MLPPQILGRIAAIQAELAGILAALPFTAQPPSAQPVASAVAQAVEPAPTVPQAAAEPEAEPAEPATAPATPSIPVAAAEPVQAPTPPAKAAPPAPSADARWSFLPDARYRVVGENPFQPGANATRFDAIVARYGAEPFTFAELEALLHAIPGDAPSSKAIVAMLQVAGRQRNTIVMAG